MCTIEIRNIGPIKEVKLDLNRVNVFMGPQSSGKSTIAKIISYCTWVEKDVATSQSLKNYEDNTNLFKEQIENFHKIKGYFRTNSYISYKSNIIEVEWKDGQCNIKWIDQYAYKRSKIAYIPAERNMITLPEVRKVEFGHTNIRSFLFDWLDVRKKYSKENNLSVLNLGIDYYYSEGNDEDHIKGFDDEREYDVLLPNASSGLQSITPLVAIIEHLTKWIYNQEEQLSFQETEKQRKVARLLTDRIVLEQYFKERSGASTDRTEKITLFNENLRNGDKEAIKLFAKYREQLKNLFSTRNSQFILEEPEQNLFPSAQRDLVYHLLEKCLNRKENRLTITTHSPYILYALNNCMMGYLVKDKMPKDEQGEMLSKTAWINPEDISIYQIKEGGVISVKDKETKVVGEHYFNGIMGAIMDEYYEMLNYFE